MKIRATLIIVILLTLQNLACSVEQEPDWKTRYAVIKQEELVKFKSPGIGDTVTLERRIGGEITGKITELTNESIALGDKQFKPSQLTPECCRIIFSEIGAASIASQRIKDEQNEYKAQKAKEILYQKEAEAKIKAQQKAAAEEALLAQKRQQAIEAEEVRSAELTDKVKVKQAREKETRTSNAGFIMMCILVFLLYIVPSVIAFTRGHSNAAAICALNILLGWTFLGWVASLVWSFTSQESIKNVSSFQQTSAGSMSPPKKHILIKKKSE